VKLNHRAAFVTGGASGIGRAIALALAREGARVAVADVNADGARRTAAEIQTAGGNAVAQPLDITDVAAVDASIDGVAAHWGGLHVLVNCAGWDRPMPFVETTPEFWDKILAVNLRGPLACTRAALRHMIPRGNGVIINMSSVLGWRAQAGQAHYAAAKAGVMALTRAAAMEAAPSGVRVNAVAPSLAMHPFLEKVMNPEELEHLVTLEAFGRSAETWEVANVIVFLASDYSSYMTGEIVSVSS